MKASPKKNLPGTARAFNMSVNKENSFPKVIGKGEVVSKKDMTAVLRILRRCALSRGADPSDFVAVEYALEIAERAARQRS